MRFPATLLLSLGSLGVLLVTVPGCGNEGPQCVIDTDCPELATRCFEGSCVPIGEVPDAGVRPDGGGDGGSPRDGGGGADGGEMGSDGGPPSPLTSDPGAGLVACGRTILVSCDVPVGDTCCVDPGAMTSSCLPASTCAMIKGGFTIACDGPEDCLGGTLCCAPEMFPGATSCLPTTCGDAATEVCRQDSDCTEGGSCVICRSPAGSVFGVCSTTGACPAAYEAFSAP